MYWNWNLHAHISSSWLVIVIIYLVYCLHFHRHHPSPPLSPSLFQLCHHSNCYHRSPALLLSSSIVSIIHPLRHLTCHNHRNWHDSIVTVYLHFSLSIASIGAIAIVIVTIYRLHWHFCHTSPPAPARISSSYIADRWHSLQKRETWLFVVSSWMNPCFHKCYDFCSERRTLDMILEGINYFIRKQCQMESQDSEN